MSLMHKLLNVMLPLATLIALLFLPPYLMIFKLLSYTKRSIFTENVAGKVVLITGASSGIGEEIAYEYARRKARLALAARRKDRLHEVARKSQELGSPGVFVIQADISKVEDCDRLVHEAVNYFGQLDHLVNNAGIMHAYDLFEDYTQVSDLAPIMDVNFWGSVYCTRFAIPHLKKTKGKIVGISSTAAWSPTPRLILYNASKAASKSFYETLRVECGSQIGVTIVTPGVIESNMTTPDVMAKLHAKNWVTLMESAGECGKAIVESACRGDMYLTEPTWMKLISLLRLLYPEAFEGFYRWYLSIH